jgi:hypothetical protein
MLGPCVLAVVVVAGLVLVIGGVVSGRWVQVLGVAVGASSLVSWWGGDRLQAVLARPMTWPMLTFRVLCCAGLCVSGVLVLVLVDFVLERIGGCLLVVSAFCGAMEIFYRVRSRAGV